MCDRHNHQLHEGGWRLDLDPDRTITLRAPDATIVFHGDTRDRVPTLDLATEPEPEPFDLLHGEPDEIIATWPIRRCRLHHGHLTHTTGTIDRHGP